MSVKSKIKKCNNEIKRLELKVKDLECQNRNLRLNIQNSDSSSEKIKLYANIIKFALTNHIGGLHGGMLIDMFGIDKMECLKLDVEQSYIEHSYIIRVR